MRHAGNPKPAVCHGLEVWGGQREGFQERGDICIPNADSC